MFNLRKSFRNKKKHAVTPPAAVDNTSNDNTSKNPQKDKLKNIEFIKSDVSNQNENFIEAFIRFLMSSSIPIQDSREEKLTYIGLASLTLISELFFNSKLITLIDVGPNNPIRLVVDIRNLKFEESKILLDKLKDFVASKDAYSIKSIYQEFRASVEVFKLLGKKKQTREEGVRV